MVTKMNSRMSSSGSTNRGGYSSERRNFRLVVSLLVLGAPCVCGSKSLSSIDCVADFSLREAVADLPS